MRLPRLIITSVCALGLTSVVAPDVEACEKMKQQTAEVTELNATQLAAMLGKRIEMILLDANGTDTRTKLGVIPGARLLSNHASYDVALELPRDRASKLVFYCSTSRCSAAPKAAQRAVNAGYTDVNVLKVGVKGWAEAGYATARPTAS